MTTSGKSTFELIIQTIQFLSVVVGVVISVLTYNDTQKSTAAARIAETNARIAETNARIAETKLPFMELRRTVYVNTVKTIAELVTAEPKTPAYETALKRFRQLYIAELTMVETKDVAEEMVKIAKVIDPNLVLLSAPQQSALSISRALGASYTDALNELPR